ncbi:MAG: replication initiation factor domain-containing protein [Clostridia bacterium]|nr:replication initiation factor domain-containing protein [Clostridia bacterium]
MNNSAELIMLHPDSQFRNGVFLSLDWVSFVCQNCSIRSLMYLLQLQKFSRTSFKKEELRIHPGNDSFAFDINGVQFCVNRTLVACYGLDVESNDIFDYVFPTVRVNFTGTGLRFMRGIFDELHVWFDQWILYFFHLDEAPAGHFTRLDFALDFVNDFSNILGNVVQHLQYGGTKDGQPAPGKFTAGSTRAYQTKLWLDPATAGCTVYLGSGASDQMLRIYNKYAESREFFSVPHIDPESGAEIFERWKPGKDPHVPGIDAGDIKSWVRFELVLRNMKAMEFTPAEKDDPCVFDHPSFFARIIHDKFRPVRTSLYVDWWQKFWDPLFDDKIVNLNLHFVQLRYSRNWALRFPPLRSAPAPGWLR